MNRESVGFRKQKSVIVWDDAGQCRSVNIPAILNVGRAQQLKEA